MLEDKPIRGILPKYCQGCRWRSQQYNSCDYILFDDHGMRGCPPGEGCTRREIGKRPPTAVPARRREYKQINTIVQRDLDKVQRQQTKKYAETSGRRLTLWQAGNTDVEIARLENKTIGAIRRWRASVGLPPNKHGFNRLTPEDENKRLALYAAGKSDPEIAKSCGVSPNAIFRWRHLRGLKGNRRK